LTWLTPEQLAILEDANAGRSFAWGEMHDMHLWVSPDGTGYNNAREHLSNLSEVDDKTSDALKKYLNMQYTHT